jgi:hypothetical protein
VRQFREGEKRETLIRFRPGGEPYGFHEQLEEGAPGAALTPEDARRIAEQKAHDGWAIDLSAFTLVEQSQERRPGGRVDHTFTYERTQPTLNEGRFRLRLVVSGDRLTEATHFIKIPEAFTRRYEEMRSANEAIGAFSSIAMVLLYIVGGIAIGLFWLMRHHWVIGRTAVAWGIVIALLQLLASLNDWPLLWMSYDTAVPRATFIAQEVASVIAAFVGFAMFFGLTFMAAESLSRRAFGDHPQLWHAWAPDAARSTAILGRTTAGYLFVTVFFAYDILLYFYATRLFGWWAPSDALIHPDVLASYFPWLSAIANSLQAGFWEESLFRAVPIAGAALLGDRFGKRNLFIVIAFVVQSIVFGAGHAPYPTQPSYSRPVELILPSIGFGLLYLWLGLLPGIVLHYTFDVIWFALPLFVSTAPGIWIDRAMVIVCTLVPLWVVLGARLRRGAWIELAPIYRNRAWLPPPAEVPEPRVAEAAPSLEPVAPGFVRVWAIAGLIALVTWIGVARFRPMVPALAVSQSEAARSARDALTARRAAVGPGWRLLPIPNDGHSEAHRFAWEEGGPERYASLLGRYLPTPRWLVRAATFEGDVADRADEWTVLVNARGEAERTAHQLPESRAAPSLTEADARRQALDAVHATFALAEPSLREVSVEPSKLSARTDWLFTFQDLTVAPIATGGATATSDTDASKNAGEARIEVEIAGSDVVRLRPFLHVPEAWERAQRGRDTVFRIIGLLSLVLAGSALVAAAGAGLVAWSRREFAPHVFYMLFAVFAAFAAGGAINDWPATLATFSTAQPFSLQVLTRVGLGVVGLLMPAAIVALAAGTLPFDMPVRRIIPRATAALLGSSLGLIVVAAGALSHRGSEPPWPDVSAYGSYVPLVAAAASTLPAFLLRSVTMMVMLSTVDYMTHGWTRRRLLMGSVLILVGAVLGAPGADSLEAWMMTAAFSGAGLLCAYVFLLRHDVSLTPFVIATLVSAGRVRDAFQSGLTEIAVGSVLGILLVALAAWWLCGLIRQARAAGAAAAPA